MIGASGGSDSWMRERSAALDALLRRLDYRGHDPFDLSNAPLFRRIPASWYYAHLLISKVGARFTPDLLRRALRVPRIEDPKIYACAYFSYWLLGEEYRESADEMIRRLCALARRNASGAYWGYEYLWATRSDGITPHGASSIVPASFALFALAHDILVRGRVAGKAVAADAVRYYAAVHLKRDGSGPYLGYFAHSVTNVHNANLLGCAALAVASRAAGREDPSAMIRECADTSMRRVRSDGYLPYSDHPAGDWTDCFHHIYVILAARIFSASVEGGSPAGWEDAFNRLESYLAREFFLPDGRVNYYPGSLYPIDNHNYAAAVLYDLFTFRDGARPAARLALADALAWDAKRGHYAHRIFRARADRRFFLRWNHAWFFLALAAYIGRDELRLAVERAWPLREKPE